MKTKKKYPEQEALKILHQLAAGLNFMHTDLGIIHRDLKPDNILCHQGVYKLSDFGLSVQKDYFSTHCGTPLYFAPEYFNDNKKGKSADIWALGTILHEMIFGQHPYWKNQG